MIVQEFVDKYNSYTNDQLKDKFIADSIVETYIPYTTKVSKATIIATNTTHIKAGEGTVYERTILSDDVNVRYVLYALQLIDWYSVISIEWSNKDNTVVNQFETLDRYGLIEIIISLISEIEVDRFSNILQGCVDNIIFNETNMVNYLDTKIDAIGLVFDQLIDVFGEKIANILDGLAEEDLINAAKSYKGEN